jgi:hypothetical protein
MSGDSFHQYGAGSIGKAEHSGSGNIVAGGMRVAGQGASTAAVDNLLEELRKLRQHLDSEDRADVDAVAAEIASNPSHDRLRNALRTVSGIATLVGEVGAPVINAARAILGSI